MREITFIRQVHQVIVARAGLPGVAGPPGEPFSHLLSGIGAPSAETGAIGDW